MNISVSDLRLQVGVSIPKTDSNFNKGQFWRADCNLEDKTVPRYQTCDFTCIERFVKCTPWTWNFTRATDIFTRNIIFYSKHHKSILNLRRTTILPRKLCSIVRQNLASFGNILQLFKLNELTRNLHRMLIFQLNDQRFPSNSTVLTWWILQHEIRHRDSVISGVIET